MNFHLDDLQDDGDETTNLQGFTLRLSIEPDESTTLDDDGDWYGTVAYGTSDPYTGRPHRPDNFDGASCRLDRYLYSEGGGYGRCTNLWWQPPADISPGTDRYEALRTAVIRVASEGYYVIGLTLTAPDGTTFSDYLCGNDSADSETLRDILPDLLSETLHQFYASAAAALHTSPEILTY